MHRSTNMPPGLSHRTKAQKKLLKKRKRCDDPDIPEVDSTCSFMDTVAPHGTGAFQLPFTAAQEAAIMSRILTGVLTYGQISNDATSTRNADGF